ncbi:hypothetical protein CB0940_03637 [Cercospora beticola]|uniref:Uncharacterized protein n=1 Tax=Cercospora beticola TaxID=122368 RepID=A0A2G5I348_CERBT|nr:hypothetical protein CB0940_03637 [Cercospora beticola]PIA98922.1 hypothetical protein CB0940_03637 [Cercospora beticola]WPB00816.1 hypothetical protein RHO25_005436 [Cercospora beticola]
MAANKPNSLSNKESHLVDPMLSETESTSYDFSFGAAAPEAATYTNSRPVLEQPAVLPQPARTLSHTKPISDHSTLPNASANAPRKRRHSHFEQEGGVIDGTSHYSSADKHYILHHQLEAYTQVTELPDTNVHTALPTLPTAGSLTSTVEQLDHARFNEQYSNADRLYQGMWQRPAPGFANDNLLGTPNTLPYPHGFLQGYVGNLYATTSSRSLAITHQAPPPFRPLAAPRVPSSTTAGLSIDLSHVIPITQPLPPIDMPTPEEILTFWPNWLTSPELAVRMQRNGMTARMIVTVHLSASGQLNNAAINKRLTDNLKKQFSHGGRHYYDCGDHWDVQTAKDDGPDDDMTANNWHTREEHVLANGVRLDGKAPPNGACWNGDILSEPTQEWKDMPLTEFFVNVPRGHFPTGQGRGMVTRCLEAVHDDPDYAVLNLTTAHWDWLRAP